MPIPVTFHELNEPKSFLPQLATIFLIVVLGVWLGRPFADLGSGWTLGRTFGAMGLVLLAAVVVNGAWLAMRGKNHPPMSKEWLDMIRQGWGFLIVMVVFVAPLLEELVFRYVLVGSLHDVSPVLAIGMSGLLFGLIHPRGPLPKVVMGCLYAWIYAESGSFWVPFALHSLWNAGVMLVARKSISRHMNRCWPV